jgi:hypothetical protein
VPETVDTPPIERLPERRILGEVRIAGTDMPLSGVVARAYLVRAELAKREGDQISLGSALVDGGRFEIPFADELIASHNGRHPGLRVKVFGSDPGKPLAESEVRAAAGRDEVFLLAVEAAALAEQGRPDALNAAAASLDPAVAARAVVAKRALAERRSRELVTERRVTVTERRNEDAELDGRIRDRALSELTGVSQHSAAWKRLVRPGTDPVEVANRYQKDVLENAIKHQVENVGTDTYLVLSSDEFQELGDPPDPKKVAVLLQGTRSEGGIERDDPIQLVCRSADVPDPFTTSPAAPVPSDAPVSELPGSPDEKIEELVGSIQPPDNITLTGPQNQTEAADRVLGLSIARGPADLPATYEFHRLELAFDHVWEDARAEGYLEAIKTMYRTVEAAGGDTDAVLKSPGTLAQALRREAQLAGVAPARPERPGVIYLLPQGQDKKRPGWDLTRTPETAGERWRPPAPPEEPEEPGPDQPTPEADPNLGHPFTVFAPNTVNFGLLVTYQQRFEPLDYQVGRMVGTRTLAPKETYSFTTRQVLKKSFNRKQMESNQRMRREEAEDSSRDEAEVVRRSQSKTNFAMSTSGGYDLGPLGEGTVSTNLGTDSESSSQETKRSQRSAVRKAAQEVKNETKIELESAATSEVELTEKREVTNVNDELALTCVFYELQRRFRVSERLFRITPVALVAQKMPSAAEINETWILRYDWIIRRFLPDDSFEPALTYLATTAAGDRVILQDLKTHMENLRATVAELGHQLRSAAATANQEYLLLKRYVDSRANTTAIDKAEGWLSSLWGSASGDDEKAQLEKIRILEEATKQRYDQAAAHERDLQAAMDRELGALQVATDAYTKALATNENRQVEIGRLIEHIRQNILLYMHGIWSYEHPDQRFLRHHTLTAPRLRPLTRTYDLDPLPPNVWPPGVTPQAGKTAYKITFTTTVDPDVANESKRATLAELLDLHGWLGMFGNYLIYPLKESNALTDFMMTPYLDNTFGLRDPDGIGNWTLEQFTEYVRCLKEKMPNDYAQLEGQLRAQYQQLLTSPHRNGEEITIPSNGVHMQMLVDPGTVLEKYKEEHRRMDVLKVREEVRTAAIDNVRRAKLVLAGDLEDPNIESVKNVYYHGPAPHDGDE